MTQILQQKELDNDQTLKEDAFEQFNSAIDNHQFSEDASESSGVLVDPNDLEEVKADWSLEDEEDLYTLQITKKTEIFEGQVVQVE